MIRFSNKIEDFDKGTEHVMIVGSYVGKKVKVLTQQAIRGGGQVDVSVDIHETVYNVHQLIRHEACLNYSAMTDEEKFLLELSGLSALLANLC